MRTRLLPCLCLAGASLTAQNYLELPSTATPSGELPSYSTLPFMQPDARVQMFYDASEVGLLPFTADELSLRFDGPIPQVGAPGPFTITRLQIRIGTTAVAIPGASFDANLTQPLTTVFDAQHTWFPDPGMSFPHPWGAPNGSLTFPFTTPVPLVVAPGEWLVIDVTMQGNNIAAFGLSHAMLDGATTSGGFLNGSAANYGQGCSASAVAPPATASVAGLYGPGGAHFLRGTNLGPNAFVLGAFGLSNTSSFVPLPFTLSGTNCNLLVSPDVTMATLADGSGAVTGASAIALYLPPNPAISGLVVYEQLASLVPAANPWGIVLSNAVAVTLGSWVPLGRGTCTVSHDADANAAYGNLIRSFGYAARLHTL